MNSAKIIVGFLLTCPLLIGCATNNSGADKPATVASSPVPSATAPDPRVAIRASFLAHCADCHRENGDGGPTKIDGKQVKVPSLKVGHALKHSDKDFAEQIAEGGDGMPAFKDKLKREEIDNLVRFIRTEFQGK